jgi:hypothetical protein
MMATAMTASTDFISEFTVKRRNIFVCVLLNESSRLSNFAIFVAKSHAGVDIW